MRFDFRRSAFVVPLVFLNLLFVVTSHALDWTSFRFQLLYWEVLWWMQSVFGLGLQQTFDVLSIGLLALTTVLAFLAFRKALRVLQIISVGIMPLGVEIYLFDAGEWNMHVMQLQADWGLIPWFSNADLFGLTAVIVVGSTLWLAWHPR